jgi:hypothetical protein
MVDSLIVPGILNNETEVEEGVTAKIPVGAFLNGQLTSILPLLYGYQNKCTIDQYVARVTMVA